MATDATIWRPPGEQGPPGPQGPAGPSIELRVTSTHIQWRVYGSPSWVDLIAIEDITGPEGPEGPQGITGDRGEKGDKGDKGDTGATGATGPQGASSLIRTGEGTPGPSVGQANDYYIDTETGDMYGPKIGSSWPAEPFVNILGPQGPEGPEGPQGVAGPKGDPGSFSQTVEISTDTRTLGYADVQKFLYCTHANGIELTLPPQSVVPWEADVEISGVSSQDTTVFVPEVGVTLLVPAGYETEVVAGAAWLLKRAAEDTWVLSGELIPT